MPRKIQLTKADIRRVWSKVIRGGVNDCWAWGGCHDRDGYGIWAITATKQYKAHRVVCFLVHGDAGSMSCHTCDNPGCVNPKHLYPGNGKQNSADRDRDGCPIRGENQHLAVLTEKQVLLVVELSNKFLANGHRYGRIPKIAGILGCKKRTIEHILRGETWTWLTKIPKQHP